MFIKGKKKMLPHWKLLNDWWVDDFVFEYEQLEELYELQEQHPDDQMGEQIRTMINMVKSRISRMQTKYQKIYGRRMSVTRIRRLINEKNNV